MAFIRHIAITSEDPAKAAEFYRKHFDMKELWRLPADTGAVGVWMTDGWIYFAILKHGAGSPKLGPEQKLDYCGIHHIGFLVDDQKQKVESLEAEGVRHVMEPPDGMPHPLSTREEGNGTINEKFIGPDWVQFDVRDRGWNEIIRSGATLYVLKPESK